MPSLGVVHFFVVIRIAYFHTASQQPKPPREQAFDSGGAYALSDPLVIWVCYFRYIINQFVSGIVTIPVKWIKLTQGREVFGILIFYAGCLQVSRAENKKMCSPGRDVFLSFTDRRCFWMLQVGRGCFWG